MLSISLYCDILSRMDDPELITKETYNRIAEQWAKEHNNVDYFQQEFEIFRSFLPKGKVLDVGCGAGRDYQFFQGGQYDYTGVDYSSGLLGVAREQFPEARFVEGNILDLPFQDQEFDGFWAAASLLHIPKDKMNKALQSIKRILKERGVGFIALEKGDGEQMVADDNHNQDMRDQRFFSYWQNRNFRIYWIKPGLNSCNFWSIRSAREPHGLRFL